MTSLKFKENQKFLKWELLWSRSRQEMVRFGEYVDKSRCEARIVQVNSLAEFPGMVPVEDLSRPT